LGFVLICRNMKKFQLIISILFLSLYLFSQGDDAHYSFFVAGHTYGNPMSPQYGLYPPFVNKISFINDYDGIEFGCLTGDVVVSSTSDYWDSAQVDIDKFEMPVYIAAGNHDIGPEFIQRYGDYYYSFLLNNDLFITLTPSLDNWNISGDQKDFLFETLDSLAPGVNNIFIFLHELIWWSPDSLFQNVIINYAPYYPGSTNFWNEIEPVLNALPNQVVLFAGDLGCTSVVTPFMYYKYDNITLIASGMGGGGEDNFIIIDVYSDTIDYNLIAINGDDINALGELTDFSLDEDILLQNKQYLSVFPNPFQDVFYVKSKFPGDYFLQILNTSGDLILSDKIRGVEMKMIPAQELPKGLYILKFWNDKGIVTRKIEKM